jgi:O-antigen ligase
VWPFYWDAFTENPVVGIGLGSGWAAPGIQEPHNLALQLLGESGLVGALGFLVLAAVLLRRRRGRREAAVVIVALLPAFFQTLLFEPTWWFAAGVFVGGIGAFSLKPSPTTVDE